MDLEEKQPGAKFGDARKFDPTFKGPTQRRGCTDVLCCIIFFVGVLAYIAVGILAWSQGDPRKVIYPTDSRGQFCGQAGTPLQDKNLVFYFNILKCASPLVLLEFQCPTTQMCVASCPNRTLTLLKAFQNGGADLDYYKQFCSPDTDFTTSVPMILSKGLCPAMLMPSKPFTRRCLPALSTKKGGVVVVGNETSIIDDSGQTVNATELLDASKKSNLAVEARQVAMRIFEDYTVSWHFILLGLLIATVLSLVFIVLLRFMAGIMIWVMIISVNVVIAYGIFHCYMEYSALKGTPGSDITINDLGLQTDFAIYLQVRETWLAFMIILAIIEVIILLLLCFLRERVMIAIALIKESSRAIGHVMSSLFYPLLTCILLALVIAYWAITAVYLSTSNEQIYKVFSTTNTTGCDSVSRNTCNPETFNTTNVTTICPDAECLFAFYGGESYYHKYLILFQFYNLFFFFWCANFITALGQVTLAGAFASYYWAFKKPEQIPANPIFSSFSRAIRYHTGSLAFGSLILSLIQIVRVILEYLDSKLKGAQNKFAMFLLKCMKCCFWCLEKCIRFLNRNAYIMIAIYGKSFCTSAKDAFFLLMRNIVRVAVLDKVTDFLLFLGKLLIVGITGICSFFFFTGKISIQTVEDATPTLNYYWVPILTVVLGSYFIAHGFFSVYGMCVDTLFLCFCEDLERNDGSAARPYYMSPKLHEILNKPMKVEENDGDEPPNGHTPLDEARTEEEIPLQEDGEVRLKHQTILLTQDNDEEHPLKTEVDDVKIEVKEPEIIQEPKEEEEEEKKPEESKDAEEKDEEEEEEDKKDETVPPEEPEKEETEENKVEKEEPKVSDPPPSDPQD